MDEEYEYDPEREEILDRLNEQLPTIVQRVLNMTPTEFIEGCWQSQLLKDSVEKHVEKARNVRIMNGSKGANN